jgi:hypothetical protein
MAKKAKSAKKAKVSTSKGASKRTKLINVPLRSVVQFVHMIEEKGNTAAFMKAAKNRKLTVRPGTVKFVRKYLADNRLRRAMVVRVVEPCPEDPFECKFRD